MPRFPDEIRAAIARRFRNRHRSWLAGDGEWPMRVSLGCPKEDEARALGADLGRWIEVWRGWPGPGSVSWHETRWRNLGIQRLPEYLVIASADDVAILVGEDRRWESACRHYNRLTALWPSLASRLPAWYDSLADFDLRDVLVAESLLKWLVLNRDTGLFPRQLPVPGMDTKWLDARLPFIADLFAVIHGVEERDSNLYRSCGLRQPPRLVRMRVLDPVLRTCAAGLGDLSTGLDELTSLSLPVRDVFIVENLQTGLAFGDRPGSVVIMGLGYGVSVLAAVPWISRARCIYWGDLDTHGFAILDRARACLPGLRSVLMDEQTLLHHRDFWGREPEQCIDRDLPHLTADEHSIYRGLHEQRWGSNVRLEQERISWDYACARIEDLAL